MDIWPSPVSYTHLDVYKRQDVELQEAAVTAVRQVNACMDTLHVADALEEIMAVSYTHLDVYKRQGCWNIKI